MYWQEVAGGNCQSNSDGQCVVLSSSSLDSEAEGLNPCAMRAPGTMTAFAFPAFRAVHSGYYRTSAHADLDWSCHGPLLISDHAVRLCTRTCAAFASVYLYFTKNSSGTLWYG
jgi:hypothetical protein